ncbi:unnamed protein product [Didymodactylos carnosus]|uniref:Ig-like domain-containing protein n=1 Tax=Didymodactylos carnosus TaxID=1234261 RepID=A0A815XUP8_9BILA|nr:unnamed protein product [Didymodactylos carnosus]CAF4423609.1 unnamed protein product [Didymodactylos carnosus]
MRASLCAIRNSKPSIETKYGTIGPGNGYGIYCDSPLNKSGIIGPGDTDVWYKDGKLLPSDRQQRKYSYFAHTIQIDNLQKNDSGIYSCKQPDGTIKDMVRLIAKPPAPSDITCKVV